MISISIVTYNSDRTIEATLRSLLDIIGNDDNYVLYLVDNASTDNTRDILKSYAQEFSNVNLILGETNIGYGAAHNKAISCSGEKYHAIVNPDIVIGDNIFAMLAQYMDAHEDVGIVSPKLLNDDGSIQCTNKRRPAAMDLILRGMMPSFIQAIFKTRIYRYEMRDVGYDGVCDVPCASGALMFCRSEVLKAVGGFDERYFLYFEDFDLSHMVQKFGYKTVYFPRATACHKWERAAKKSITMASVFAKSGIRYFNKWGWKLF